MKAKEKKQIVFVNQSSGYLMIDIIHEHLNEYDELILVTGFLNPRNNPLDSRVKVCMLNKYDRSSTAKRLFTWFIFTIRTWLLLLFKYRNADLFLVSNPPFVVFLSRLLRNKCTYLIYDVYPDVLIQYNVVKEHSWLVKVWEKVNRKVFSEANHVYTIGYGMKELLEKYVSPSKLKVVPVWSDNSFLRPLEKTENPFIVENNLQDKFTIMYSGNIGKTHPVEILLELADKLKQYPVEVLIIGEGAKKNKIMLESEERKLENIRFLPFQSTDMFPKSLAAADLSVVTLGEEAAQLSVPSKTFNIMSVKVPILAIASHNSEISKIIDKYNNGACFEAAQLNEIIMFVERLIQENKYYELLANNSLKASLSYTPANATKLKFKN